MRQGAGAGAGKKVADSLLSADDLFLSRTSVEGTELKSDLFHADASELHFAGMTIGRVLRLCLLCCLDRRSLR